MDIKSKAKDAGKILWHALQEYLQRGGSNMAAALAFYSVFSLAPLLVVVVAVVGFFFGDEAAHGEVYTTLKDFLGRDNAKFVQEMVLKAGETEAKGFWASVIGLGTLLYGSSKVFNALRDGLNVIWQVPPDAEAGFMETVKDYALSLALVPGFGILFLVMILSSTILSAFGDMISSWATLPSFVPRLIDTGLSLFFLTLIFGFLFRLLPDVKIAWRDVAAGAGLTSLFFVLGKIGISYYLAQSSTGSVFGAAGTLAVLLMWFFFSSQIFFFGSALTHSIYLAHREGIEKLDEDIEAAKRAPKGGFDHVKGAPKPDDEHPDDKHDDDQPSGDSDERAEQAQAEQRQEALEPAIDDKTLERQLPAWHGEEPSSV